MIREDTDLTTLDALPKPTLWRRLIWWIRGLPEPELSSVGATDDGSSSDYNGFLLRQLDKVMEDHEPPAPRNAWVKLGPSLTRDERSALNTAKLLDIPVPTPLHERSKTAGTYERQTFAVPE